MLSGSCPNGDGRSCVVEINDGRGEQEVLSACFSVGNGPTDAGNGKREGWAADKYRR